MQEKVIQFYNGQNTVCYDFEERRYFLNGKSLVSRGEILCYKVKGEVFYRGTHAYDLFRNIKFESIKNESYFGVNHFEKKYFEDYSILPEKKRFYAYHNSPKDVLKPDTSLRSAFYDPDYYLTLSSDNELYRLVLSDTNRIKLDPDGYRTKRIKVYYISKKDYSILKYSLHTFWTSGDKNNNDSVVVTYNYKKIPIKKIKTYINEFEPLTGRKPARPDLNRDDSLKIFPEFHLPDASGKIKEVDSRYVLVDFWYKACAPCMANMKQLDKIALENVQIVAINVRDSVDNDIRNIVLKYKFNFLFQGAELAKELNLQAYPTMYVYDRKREIVFRHIGLASSQEIMEVLKKLPQD